MANRLHDSWKRAKDGLAKDVARVKKDGGLNPKQLEDALKSFSGGFGKLLDKIAAAFKANKGDDVVKHATAALAVGQRYLQTLQGISNERGKGAELVLKDIIRCLTELKEKGMNSRNHF